MFSSKTVSNSWVEAAKCGETFIIFTFASNMFKQGKKTNKMLSRVKIIMKLRLEGENTS